MAEEGKEAGIHSCRSRADQQFHLLDQGAISLVAILVNDGDDNFVGPCLMHLPCSRVFIP